MHDGEVMALTSRSELDHPGHDLTYVDEASGELTTLELHGFSEELDAYVHRGTLVADHAFWISGLPFLVLRCTMHRKQGRV